VEGVADNLHPDVFARGWYLLDNKLTVVNGQDQPVNVTSLSLIAQESYFQCTSPFVFTDNGKYTIPICTQWFTDPTVAGEFKYIPDFFFRDADFTISTNIYWWPCWKSQRDITMTEGNYLPCYPMETEAKKAEPQTVLLFPNPVEDVAFLTVNLLQPSHIRADIADLLGNRVLSQNMGHLQPGSHQFSLDVSGLSPGVYIVAITVGCRQYTRKLLVE
jgi:hypothetical protein